MTVDKIKEIKCFILDMDGTIYLGNELFDFTKDFLNKVEETGREYYLYKIYKLLSFSLMISMISFLSPVFMILAKTS